MDTKLYRLREFVHHGRSLVIDTSRGLTFGALPGLEKFSRAVEPVLPLVDGVVTSPGQARTLATRTREDAALLVRADWSNAQRGADFVLPPETIFHLPLLRPANALDLGASALVIDFLLGHTEEIEAQCVRNTVQFALEGSQIGMPLLVDVQPVGPRVVLRTKAIELGVSYALEGGADGMVLPWPGAESLKTIKTMVGDLPVWLRPTTLDTNAPELSEALDAGAVGFWLDERVFAASDPLVVIEAFRKLVYAAEPAGAEPA